MQIGSPHPATLGWPSFGTVARAPSPAQPTNHRSHAPPGALTRSGRPDSPPPAHPHGSRGGTTPHRETLLVIPHRDPPTGGANTVTLEKRKGLRSVQIINNKTELAPLDAVRPHPRNPRQGDTGAIHESIQANGFYGAIIAQKSTGFILAGNHRWQAAQQAGATEVPVTWVDVDDDHALRILLADNRTNDLASYDDNALAELLQDIHEAHGNLMGTGYDGDDLDQLLADLGETPDAGPAPEAQIDRAEELREKWGTALGQLWVIGRHRLLCGDSTNPENVSRLLDGGTPDLALHDPPYGIAIVESGLGDGRRHGNAVAPRGKFTPIANDAAPFDPTHLLGVGRTIVLWGANHYADKLPPSAAWIVWDKRVDLPSNGFSDCELAWVSKGGSARIVRHTWNGMIRDSERGEARLHPTQKPVQVQAEVIRHLTDAGASVADFYLGSGTTLLAAEQTQRIGYGLELEPKYVAVTLERLADAGLTPELADD